MAKRFNFDASVHTPRAKDARTKRSERSFQMPWVVVVAGVIVITVGVWWWFSGAEMAGNWFCGKLDICGGMAE